MKKKDILYRENTGSAKLHWGSYSEGDEGNKVYTNLEGEVVQPFLVFYPVPLDDIPQAMLELIDLQEPKFRERLIVVWFNRPEILTIVDIETGQTLSAKRIVAETCDITFCKLEDGVPNNFSEGKSASECLDLDYLVGDFVLKVSDDFTPDTYV